MTTATQNQAARMNLQHLKDLGLEPASCGLFHLTDKQLEELVIAVQRAVNLEGRKAFDAAMGR